MKKSMKKLIALCLSMIYIISLFQLATGAASIGQNLYESTVKIANNASYTNLVAWHGEHGRQEANVITFDPQQQGVSAAAMYGSKLYGRSNMNQIANYAQQTENKYVVGGINGDFYSFQTGVPMGMVIHNGRLITSDDSFPAIGFLKDGTCIIGAPELSVSVDTPAGAVEVSHFNKYRTEYGVYLFSDDFSTESKTSAPGTHIVLEILEGEIGVGQTLKTKVVDLMEDATNIKMLPNSLLLSVDNNGPLDKIADIVVGQEISVTFKANGGSQWNEVQEAIGAGEYIVQNGSVVPKSNQERHPRTAIGIKANGEVVLAQVDGRIAGHSKGATLTELGEFMLEQGCVTALNLDGGGSSTTLVRMPGDTNTAVVNELSDGSLRQNANFVLLHNTATWDDILTHLQIYPYDFKALPNAKVKLSVKGMDGGYYAKEIPSSAAISYELDSEIGTVEQQSGGWYFVAGGDVGQGNITAHADTATGQTGVTVVDRIDELYLYKKGSTKAIETIDLKPGESFTFDVAAYLNGQEIYADVASFTWEVVGENLGTITAPGTFVAGNEIQKEGQIKVSYQGFSKIIKVTVGKNVVDSTAPIITFDSLADWDPSSPELQIRAVVTDNTSALPKENISMECDGNAIAFNFAQEDGVVTATMPNEFTSGLHKIGITAKDNHGNIATKYQTIDIPAQQEQTIFADTKSHWAGDFIDYIYNAGLAKGSIDSETGLRYYKPETNISRAEFAAMLCRYLQLDTSEYQDRELPFIDEKNIPQWAVPEVRAIYGYGVMTGKPAEGGQLKFDPMANLTRAEIMTAIGRLFPDGYAQAPLNFTDANKVGDWASKYVKVLIGMGVVNGYSDGTLKPDNFVKRAEVAKIFYAIY